MTSAGSAQPPRFAYVGCRTTRERNARGEGLRVFSIDPATRAWREAQLIGDLVNPSFLAFDRTGSFLYTVHGDMSEISAFRVDKVTGRLSFINRVSTEGRNPVHLVCDATNRFVIVANYATGSLVVLPRRNDGGLDPVRSMTTLPGMRGPNKIDQTSSHPHHVVYDRSGRFLAVPDKGLDRIFTFAFDPEKAALAATDVEGVKVRPGAGPRHIAFHPNGALAFVAHELDASVGSYRYDATTGRLTPVEIIPSIPRDFVGANTASEIDISASGRFVYVSNRGHDSIGVFAVDPTRGALDAVRWVSSEGRGPRFATLDPTGERFYAANENSDSIVTYGVDAQTGMLTRDGDAVATGSPVCIVFSPPEAA